MFLICSVSNGFWYQLNVYKEKQQGILGFAINRIRSSRVQLTITDRYS
ncbi:hypothetical protein [Wolbachia endosymbiont of Frankliniella intonsa]|nr:hypothetical protein [Wolbachia endosymbiont of Frankliniella intonsa]WGJ62547.1 hypothetical protein M3L71_02860 [Wolbachia endosymbiont of Frankliniella intonsa]